MIGLVVLLMVWTTAGWGLARLVLGASLFGRLMGSEKAGLAVGLGVGVTATAQFWAGCLHVPISLTIQLVCAGVLGLGVLASALARGQPASPASATQTLPDLEATSRGRSAPAPRGLLTVAIALATGLVFAQAVTAPLTEWDARVIWAFKARLLYDAGTFRTEDFYDPGRVHPHPNYPLLVPLAEASLWQWIGSTQERPVKLLFAGMTSALLLVLAGGLRELAGRTVGLALTALAAWCPLLCVHEWGGASGHADVLLAFFHAASTLWLLRWLFTGQPRAAILAGVLAAMGIFTKNEGLALWALNALGAAAAWLRHRPGWGGWLTFVLVPVGVCLPWFIVRAGLPDTADENYLAILLSGQWNLDRIGLVAGAIGQEMFGRPDHWGGVWHLAVVFALLRWRSLVRPPVRLVLGPLVLYVLVVMFMYMLSPWTDVRFHMAVSLPRVLLQVMPSAVVLIGLTWAPADRSMAAMLADRRPACAANVAAGRPVPSSRSGMFADADRGNTS